MSAGRVLRSAAAALLLLPVLLPLAAPPAEAARVAPMADLPTPFLGAAAVWTGKYVFLFGGREAENRYRADILRYDPATGQTTDVGDLPPSSVGPAGRQSMAAVWTGSKAYLFGGAVVDPATKTPRGLTDIVEFDPETLVVRNVHKGGVDALPEPLFGMGAAWINGRAYLFGGLEFVYVPADSPVPGQSTTIEWKDTIYVFDPAAPAGQDKVSRSSVRLPYAVQDMAVATLGDTAYLLGGLALLTDGQDRAEIRQVPSIVRFDPGRGEATLLDVNLPRRLHFHSAGVFDGTVYVLGGREARMQDGQEIAVTSEAILEWRPGSSPREHPLTLPIPRYAAATVTTPYGILLLGGRDSGENDDGMDSVLAFTGVKTPPTAPTVRVTTTPRVVVSWDPPAYDGGSAITGYRVERQGEDGATVPIQSVGPGVRSVVDSTAPAAGRETYRVLAVNAIGDGAAGAARADLVARPPEAPAEFAAWAGNGEVLLRWTEPPTDGGAPVRGYVVERTLGDATVRLNATTTTFVDTGVQNGVTYVYRVAARNPHGVGPATDPAEAVPRPVPAPPGSLQGADDGERVRLEWPAVAEARWYEVLRGATPVGLEFLANVTDTAFVDEDVEGGRRWWYAVRAANEHGRGPPGAVFEVARLEPAGPPTGLSALAGADFVRLQWSAPERTGGVPADALTYLVERSSGGSDFTVVTSDLKSTAWTDRRVDPGSEYRYRVVAVNTKGRGEPSTDVLARVVVEENQPPRAALTARPAGTTGGVEVTLDASYSSDPDGRVVEYRFDFGDGAITDWLPTPTATHAYMLDGVYAATVSVRDDRGAESLRPAIAQVIIGAPPEERDAKLQPTDPPQGDEDTTPPDDAEGAEPGGFGVPGAGLAALAAAGAGAALLRRRR